MAEHETLAALIKELHGALRGCQAQWGDPLDEQSALRKGLRAELKTQLGLHTRAPGIAAGAVEPPYGIYTATKVGDSLDVAAARNSGRDSHENSPKGMPRLSTPQDIPRLSFADSVNELRRTSEDRNPRLSSDSADDTRAASEDGTPGGVAVRNGPSISSSITNSGHIRCDTLGSVKRGDTLGSDLEQQSSSFRSASKRSGRLTSLNLDSPSGSRDFSGKGVMARLHHTAWRMVHHGFGFDVAMGLVILANSLGVGLELQWDLEGKEESKKITKNLEHIFLVLFVLELGVRVLADGGRKALKGSWFKFDVLLVGIGVVSSWVIEPALGSGSEEGIIDTISQILIMRILRLLRLIRALRLVEAFRDLWKLVNGLMGSIRTVLSALGLVMLTIYIFACLGIELITRNSVLMNDPITAPIIEEHFPSLPITMLTLVQFANADSIADVYAPLMKKVWWLVFYFTAVWLIVTISLMNLVTAVIVDNAIAQGGMDRELESHMLRKKLKEMEPHINTLFSKLDSSGDGYLQLNEIKYELERMTEGNGLDDLPEDLQHILDAEKLQDLFEFLDTDGSGDIDREEFFEGICHLALESVPIETTQTLQLLRSQTRSLNLIRDMTCFQGEAATLAGEHPRGTSSLSINLAPQVRIGHAESEESTIAKESIVTLHLSKPLEKMHAGNSIITTSAPHTGGRAYTSVMSGCGSSHGGQIAI